MKQSRSNSETSYPFLQPPHAPPSLQFLAIASFEKQFLIGWVETPHLESLAPPSEAYLPWHQNFLKRSKLQTTACCDLAQLLPTLQALLSDRGRSLLDCQAIFWSRGPGSFVGLRALSTLCQTLRLLYKIPVMGLSSLELLALMGGVSLQEERRALVSLIKISSQALCLGTGFWEKGDLKDPWWEGRVASPNLLEQKWATLLASRDHSPNALPHCTWLGFQQTMQAEWEQRLRNLAVPEERSSRERDIKAGWLPLLVSRALWKIKRHPTKKPMEFQTAFAEPSYLLEAEEGWVQPTAS